MDEKIICPKCGAKEGEHEPDFGFYLLCAVPEDTHAWCYSCNHVFQYKKKKK